MGEVKILATVNDLTMNELVPDHDFPLESLVALEEQISRPRWVVPVKPKEELDILLNAAVELCRTGLDIKSEHCQKFFRKGLKTSFEKLFTSEWVHAWKNIIQDHIFERTKTLIELCVAKLSQNTLPDEGCLPLLDSLAVAFSPECEFHKVNRLKCQTISKSDDAVFAKPVIECDPKGWLVDFVNLFGEKNGFDIMLEIFSKPDLPSVQVIAALLKPCGLCSNVLTKRTMVKYLLPIMGFLYGLSDEELKELWQSDELSTILLALEEILYACPEGNAETILDLKKIQQRMRVKLNLTINQSKLESETVGGINDSSNDDKVMIEFTKEQIRPFADTFTCIICLGIQDKPMFATCCRSLIACKSCLDQWCSMHTLSRCPKCRAQTTKESAVNIASMSDVINELPLNDMSNGKVEIEFTKKQIRTFDDTFTCIICLGILDKPMFATCCHLLIACKSCLEQWYRMSARCPKCRDNNAQNMAFEVAGMNDVINALPLLKASSTSSSI